MTARPAGYAPFITFCVLFALVMFLPALLNDGDTLWQIRTGEWILNHRAIPDSDPFSYTAGARHWFAHEWGAEVLMALAFRLNGMQGVMELAAAAVGLTGAVLIRYLRCYLPGIYAVLFLVFALVNAAPSMLARPHLLAWPCLVLWCAGLLRARAAGRAPSWWLLSAMLVWVNLHGSFMIGLLLPFPFMVEALLAPGADRPRVATRWGGFIAAAWATALLNPDTIGGLLFPFQMVGMKSLALIGEWQPISFGSPQPVELVILAGLAAGLSGAVTIPPIRLIMLLALLHGTLMHARNEQLLGLIGAMLLAEPVGLRLRHEPEPTGRGPRRLAIIASLCAVLALFARLRTPLDPAQTGEEFTALMRRVPASVSSQPVLNEYGLGGHLIFAGLRPFIDSRADLYGDAFLDAYRKISTPEPAALAKALADNRIVWSVFHTGHPVVAALDQTPGWKRLAEAGDIVVQVRTDAIPP